MHSSAAAEKSDEGMALKIRTRAEDIPDVFFRKTSGLMCHSRLFGGVTACSGGLDNAFICGQ